MSAIPPPQPLMQDLSSQIHRTARFRCTFIPGAGLRTLGYPRAALAGYAILALLAGSLVWIALALSTISIQFAVVIATASVIFWIVEFILLSRLRIHDAPGLSRTQFVAITIIAYALLVGSAILLGVNVGHCVMAGNQTAMSPTVDPGEHIFYRRGINDSGDLRPGRVILFKTGSQSRWGTPGTLVVARILAGPGQRISRSEDRYRVDGQERPASNPPKEKTSLAIGTTPTVVPPNCYFVAQNNPAAYDSQVFGWVQSGDIVSTRLWRVWRGVVQE